MRVELPCAVDYCPPLQQVAGEIERRPGRAVVGFVMVFEKLLPEVAPFLQVRDLNIQYPIPKSPSRVIELRIPQGGRQNVQQLLDIDHISGNPATPLPCSKVDAERPWGA